MTDLEKRVLSRADDLKDELFAALSCLVQQNTENFNSHGNEQNIVACLSDLYSGLGLTVDVFSPESLPGFKEHEAYLPGGNLANRPNVCAVWPGSRGERRIMIAGHSDTVQIGDEKLWTVPPLGGLIKDGKIWGRGANDDKKALAVGWFVVKVLKSLAVQLKDDVILAAYCDEESGGGHGALAAVLKYPADVYVNLDGSDGMLSTHATGGGLFRVSFKCRHATETAQPVYEAVRCLVDHLAQFGEKRRRELSGNPVFAQSSTAKQAYRLNRIEIGGPGGTDMGRATVEFMFYSLLPQAEVLKELDDLLAKSRQTADQFNVDIGQIEHTTRYFKPVMPDGVPAAAEKFSAAVAAVTGKPAAYEGMCLSDLPMFYYYGQGEVFNYGVGGNFARPGGAHQVDERIDCEELLNMAKSVLLFLLGSSA